MIVAFDSWLVHKYPLAQMLQFDLFYKLQELRLQTERIIITSNDISPAPECKVPKPNESSTANPRMQQIKHDTLMKLSHAPGQSSFASSGGDYLQSTTSVASTPVSRPLPAVPFHSLTQHISGNDIISNLHGTQNYIDSVRPDAVMIKDKIFSLIQVIASTTETEGGIEAISDMIIQATSLNEVAQIVGALKPKFPVGPVLKSISQIFASTA